MDTISQELETERTPAIATKQRNSNSTKVFAWLRNVPFVGLHLSCLAVFFVHPDWLSLPLCGFLYFARTFGISAGYHRYFSHHAYKTSRVVQFALALLGCSAMQKGPLWWAAHHRAHHRHTDTPEDPHSPRVRNFWWSHVGWVLSADHDGTNWPAVRDWTQYGNCVG